MEIEIINYPEEIHLILDGQIDNLDEVESEIDFDSFDHEFTFWGQGLSTSKKDINYILESKYATLHSELEKSLELISELISKRDSKFMHDVVVKAGAFLNEGKK